MSLMAYEGIKGTFLISVTVEGMRVHPDTGSITAVVYINSEIKHRVCSCNERMYSEFIYELNPDDEVTLGFEGAAIFQTAYLNFTEVSL